LRNISVGISKPRLAYIALLVIDQGVFDECAVAGGPVAVRE